MQLITFVTGMAVGAVLGFVFAALLHAGNVEEWEQEDDENENQRDHNT